MSRPVRDRLEWLFRGHEQLDLTSGSIGKPLFFLSLPIVVTNLLQTAYNLADTFWLGQYSTEALAAISFAFPQVFLLIALGMGLSIAGSVLVAQHTGAGEEADARYAAAQTLSFSLLFALVLGGLAFFVVEDTLALLGASPTVLSGATRYMRVITLGLVFMFGFLVFTALLRGYGDTRTPMLVMFGSVALNIALDPVLIFGWGPVPEYGIQGAAIATVVCRALALAVGIGLMLSGRHDLRIRLGDMIPDRAYVRRLIRVGAPASVEMTGTAVSVNLLMVVVGLFSTTVVAGFGISFRVFTVFFLPAVAVGRGVETMTGQNVGAGKPDRAATAAGFAAKVTFVVLLGLGLLAWIWARPIIGLFTTDPAVVDVGVAFTHYVAPTFGFIGVWRSYTGSFRGAGKTLTAAAITIVMLGVVRISGAYVGAVTIGTTGIWIGFAASNVVGGLLAYAWYQRGTWRTDSLASRGSARGSGSGATDADAGPADVDAAVETVDD